MPKLPSVKGKQLLKILQNLGYILDHIQGSHHVLRRSDGKKTIIPIHSNKEIPKGTLLGILTDLDISKEEFMILLKNKSTRQKEYAESFKKASLDRNIKILNKIY